MADQQYAPGWSPEFQERLSKLISELGTLKEAGEVAEASHDQLASWRDGKSRMPLHAAVRLCEATGRSVDWLAGRDRGVGRSIDAEVVRAAAAYILNAAVYLRSDDPDTVADAIAQRAEAMAREIEADGLIVDLTTARK